MRVIFSIFFLLLLAACSSDMQVSTELNKTEDIKKGLPVFFSGEIVGEVTKVKQNQDNTELTIELNDKGQSSINQNAAVVVNRLKSNTPLEIYNKQTETELIQDEGQLTGLNSMLELGAWMLGDSMNSGTDSLSNYVGAFQRYLKGDKFQQDKQELQRAAEQLGEEVQGMTQALEQEVNKGVESLAEAEEQAAQTIEQLGDELAPIVGELSKSSQAVVEELEKFTQNLEAQSEQGKELGSTILSSFLNALETVNDSIESPSINSEQTLPENNPEVQNSGQ